MSDQFDSQKILDLIKAGNGEEAKAELQSYLGGDVPKEEQGRMYALLAEAYIDAATALNQEEAELVSGFLDLLKNVDQKEQKLNDQEGLAQARAILK